MDFSNIKYTGGDYNKENIIINETVSFHIGGKYRHRTTGQYMTFDYENHEITILYEVFSSVDVHYDPGDYWTPPSEDVDVTDFTIDIIKIKINNYNCELRSDIRCKFIKEIEKNL